MLRSKSRSGFMDFGRKSQKSAISRTFSASKFCRGDPLVPQIDCSAHKPLDRNNSLRASPSEAMNQLLEELKMTKAVLEVSEQEKERALDELREMKLEMELSRKTVSHSPDKDTLIDGLEVELSIFKANQSVLTESLSASKRRIKELEIEIEKFRLNESNSELGKLENLDNYELSLHKSESKLNAIEKLESKEMELEQNAKLLGEAKLENEQYKHTIEKLSLEASESLLAWNEREIGFLKCVKDVEEEKTRIQKENIRLIESLKSANSTIDTFREENLKLKAVIKQAMGIAEIEKSLQLNRMRSENRKLSVKELNQPLIVAPMKDWKIDSKKQATKNKSLKVQKNGLSFDLSELKRANANEDFEVPIKAEILTGSIFDNSDTPKLVTRRVSFSLMNDKTDSSEEVSDFDDSGNSWISKRRAFLQSFEDLIKGKSAGKD